MAMRGAKATAISSIAAFHLREPQGDHQVVAAALRELYGSDQLLNGMATQTFSVLEQMNQKLKPDYAPAHGAKYPESPFGQALQQIAQIARGDLGMEVACADIGGWDTHANQGNQTGASCPCLMHVV